MAARPPFIEKFLIVSFIHTDQITNEPRILWGNKAKLPFLSRQGEREERGKLTGTQSPSSPLDRQAGRKSQDHSGPCPPFSSSRSLIFFFLILSLDHAQPRLPSLCHRRVTLNFSSSFLPFWESLGKLEKLSAFYNLPVGKEGRGRIQLGGQGSREKERERESDARKTTKQLVSKKQTAHSVTTAVCYF